MPRSRTHSLPSAKKPGKCTHFQLLEANDALRSLNLETSKSAECNVDLSGKNKSGSQHLDYTSPLTDSGLMSKLRIRSASGKNDVSPIDVNYSMNSEHLSSETQNSMIFTEREINSMFRASSQTDVPRSDSRNSMGYQSDFHESGLKDDISHTSCGGSKTAEPETKPRVLNDYNQAVKFKPLCVETDLVAHRTTRVTDLHSSDQIICSGYVSDYNEDEILDDISHTVCDVDESPEFGTNFGVPNSDNHFEHEENSATDKAIDSALTDHELQNEKLNSSNSLESKHSNVLSLESPNVRCDNVEDLNPVMRELSQKFRTIFKRNSYELVRDAWANTDLDIVEGAVVDLLPISIRNNEALKPYLPVALIKWFSANKLEENPLFVDILLIQQEMDDELRKTHHVRPVYARQVTVCDADVQVKTEYEDLSMRSLAHSIRQQIVEKTTTRKLLREKRLQNLSDHLTTPLQQSSSSAAAASALPQPRDKSEPARRQISGTHDPAKKSASCICCGKEPREIVLPCRHFGVCIDCFQRIDVCPVCFEPV